MVRTSRGRSHWSIGAVALVANMALVSGVAIPASPAFAPGRVAHQAGLVPMVADIHVAVMSSTSVVVDAVVNPEGSDTTYYVTYGVGSAFSSSTPVLNAGAGTSGVLVSAPLEGLKSATTYVAELVATNAFGTVKSGEVPFSTTSGAGSAPGPGSRPSPTSTLGSPLAVLGTNAGPTGLSGVSCWATGCWAVGERGDSLATDRPLVARWSAGGFTSAPAPAGPGASLYSVSCPGSDGCVAVGRAAPNAYSAELTQGRWRSLATPSPRTLRGDILKSVSCVSMSYYWAVGFTDGFSTGMAALVEMWNGRGWRVVATPRVGTSLLNAVSCVSRVDCWAGGAASAFPAIGWPLFEHWNGRTWTVVHGVASLLASGVVNAVDCYDAVSCWAAVATPRSNRVVRAVDGRWGLVVGTAALDEAGATAVACSALTACWFVGYGMFAGLWSPTGWTSGELMGHAGGGLLATSCLASGECVAAGTTMNIRTDSPSSMRSVAYVLHAPS